MPATDETPTSEAFLRTFHNRAAGLMATSVFANPMADGRTSYRFLADQVAGAQRVLDLGCADGTLLAVLAGDGVGELAGVDLSEGELALARRRPELRAADLCLARAQELPFAADSFDAIVSHMAFLLMSDIEQVVSEMARVLRPGGRFATTVAIGPVPGGALELFLSLARPAFAALPPQRRVPPMGDRRARSRTGLDEVLGPSGFTPVAWQEITLALSGTPEQVWDVAVPTYYDTAMLDDEQFARLREEFLDRARASAPSGLDGGIRLAVATARLDPA